MSSFQLGSIVFIVALPALVWWWDRHPHRRGYVKLAERLLALALVAAVLSAAVARWLSAEGNLATGLPMQLCDWAFFAIVPALWWRWKPGFDVAYFWGISGTLQAIFTPALADEVPWLRKFEFFFIHAGIVAGVVHLIATARFRPVWPRSIVRIVVASELYLATALAANALTGGNYGFLSHKPEQRSMLDLFSDTPWLYVVQLNLVAFVFFAALYVPWWIVDLRSRTARATRPV